MFRNASIGFVLVVLSCSMAKAEHWSTKMFQTTSHDFGSVARSAKTEFAFVFKNNYMTPVHVASVRSSCGCTTPRIEKNTLQTYEESAIIAHFNSDRFLGHKSATLTVTFDRPSFAQVLLHVQGNIRPDVVLQPSSVAFGAIDQGNPAQKSIAISRAGRSDWRILDVQSSNPHLSGTVIEIMRYGNRVSYDLAVQLDGNTPVGYFRDHLVLVTNDYQSRKELPVMVEATIEADIRISPESLFFGVLQSGKEVTKQLVVRAKRPFRIVSISSVDPQFEFHASIPIDAKLLHLVPVTFTGGNTPGKVVTDLRIETDLNPSISKLSVYAVVTE